MIRDMRELAKIGARMQPEKKDLKGLLRKNNARKKSFSGNLHNVIRFEQILVEFCNSLVCNFNEKTYN